MILKVIGGNGFKIYGPFHEIYIDERHSIKEENPPVTSSSAIEPELLEPSTWEASSSVNWKKAILYDMYGKEFKAVVFCSQAYLCNDDGRTIERL